MIPEPTQFITINDTNLRNKDKKKTQFFSNRDLNQYTNVDLDQQKILGKNKYGMKNANFDLSFSVEKSKELQSHS